MLLKTKVAPEGATAGSVSQLVEQRTVVFLHARKAGFDRQFHRVDGGDIAGTAVPMPVQKLIPTPLT